MTLKCTAPERIGKGRKMADPVEMHLRWLRQWQAESSIYSRRRALLRMRCFLGKQLVDASRDDLAAWRESLHLAPASIASYVSHAREFYAWAIGEHLVDANPVDGLRVPPVPRLLPRPIDDGDLIPAVLAAPQPVRLMLVLSAWCGLRAKEIALLRRSAIRERARPPVLMVAWHATKGSSERLVPLSPFVIDEMAAFGLPRTGLVFRRRDGRPGGLSPASVSHYCCDYLHESGIAETLHGGRHRFATKLMQETHDIRMVQEVLGHQRPDTTAIYTKVSSAATAAAVAALPAPGLRAAR